MPCSSGIDYTQEELDKVTRLLCETCQTLVRADQIQLLSKEAADWWAKHQRIDSEREIQRAEEQKAVDKMFKDMYPPK